MLVAIFIPLIFLSVQASIQQIKNILLCKIFVRCADIVQNLSKIKGVTLWDWVSCTSIMYHLQLVLTETKIKQSLFFVQIFETGAYKLWTKLYTYGLNTVVYAQHKLLKIELHVNVNLCRYLNVLLTLTVQALTAITKVKSAKLTHFELIYVSFKQLIFPLNLDGMGEGRFC